MELFVAISEWSRVDTCRYPQVHAENGRLLAVFRIVVAVRELIMSFSLSLSLQRDDAWDPNAMECLRTIPY